MGIDMNIFDEFGPERIITVYDTKTGMKGAIVFDNTARGPGKGGCRMAANLTLSTLVRLARTMTWKWAMVDIMLGGAKAGIFNDPDSPNKEEIIRAFARALRDHIPSRYVFGLDMGLNEKDAAIIIDELDDMSAAVGTPLELGGIPYDQLGLTGFGVAVTTDTLTGLMGLDPKNMRVSVQGLGAVGSYILKFLAEKGFNIVAASSKEGAIYDPNGLDVDKILKLKEVVGDRAVKEYGSGQKIPLGEELLVDCDILIPAAKEDVITMDNVKNIKAKVIVEGANLPTTLDAQKYLFNNGTLSFPDFISNAGGVIGAGLAMDRRFSVNRHDINVVYETVEKKISANTVNVYNEIKRRNQLPREVVLDLAKERVVKAMKLRGRM